MKTFTDKDDLTIVINHIQAVKIHKYVENNTAVISISMSQMAFNLDYETIKEAEEDYNNIRNHIWGAE